MGKRGLAVGVAGLVAGLAIGAAGVGRAAGTPSATSDDCSVQQYAMGLRYQQQSANIAALQRQTYLLATRNLDAMVRHTPKRQRARLAVMTDLDETAIDNTALYARDVNACHDFTTWDDWSDWELHGDPVAIPGALAFFRHADRLGVSIFYVSDRYQQNKPATLATLRGLGFPQVGNAHVLLLGPSKAVRRADIERHHRLVMQLGDSMADLDAAFAGASEAQQRQLVVRDARHFGRDWIVLPNAAYGDWSTDPLVGWSAPLPTS